MSIYFSESVGGFLNSDSHKILAKDAVVITDEDYQALLKGQSMGGDICIGISGPKLILPPALTLSDVKDNKGRAINQWRDSQEIGNFQFEYGGHHWDGDIASKSRVDETLALTKVIGVVPDGFFWTSADDVDIPITLLELEALAEALYAARGLRGFEIHARQRQMKAEVNALTTIEEVQAYPVSWPAEVTA